MRNRLLAPGISTLCLTLTATTAVAQGDLPLEGAFHFVNLEARYFGCAGPGTYEYSGGTGQVVFAADGTLTLDAARRDICQDGTITDVTEMGTGTHVHDALGTLVLDLDPSMPGTEITTLRLRFDHGLVLIGGPAFEFPALGLALPTSTGATNGLLDGSYTYVRQLLVQLPAGLTASSELGSLAFDGVGGFASTGVQNIVGPTSAATVVRSIAGGYAVNPDGSLAIGASGAVGATSPDGGIVTWIERFGSTIALNVAVRREGTASPADVFGPWDLAGLAVDPGLGPDDPRLQTVTGLVELDGAGGAFLFDGQELTMTPSGTTVDAALDSGVLGVFPNGLITTQNSTDPTPQYGVVSSDGSLALLADLFSPEKAQVFLLPRRLVDPAPYGTATAGSGGVAPVLSTSGGAPFLGNSVFAYEVDAALGGAPVWVFECGGPLLGAPLAGGQVWIDPSQLVLSFTGVASGPAGAAGVGSVTLSAPVPAAPALAGLDLYAQALVADAGAPAGFALSSALALQLW
jgi:hypothetical protein